MSSNKKYSESESYFFANLSSFIPKFFICLKEGYSLEHAKKDFLAGLTVAIVSLPLAMALAIASGSTPDRGIYTAIIAGFFVSLLGGSRHQIDGPTGALVIVIFNVIQQYGYDGLVFATLTAGIILVILGILGFGVFTKYIPYPLVTGFTGGIAVIIFSTQIKDFFGLNIVSPPSEFIPKWISYFENFSTWQPQTVFISLLTLGIIIYIKHYKPFLPGFLISIIIASIFAWLFGLEIDTIGSRFNAVSNATLTFQLPTLISLEKFSQLFPSALVIAFLVGIESLLAAIVADGMTGRRHKSDCELVAQGIANISSVLFGGIPATGALARTATNIKTGGQTPIAGIIHAVALFVFIAFFASLINWIPIASLSAVLVVVSWNMSQFDRIKYLFSAPKSDRMVLFITFTLTVFIDLTVAIAAGLIFASLSFVKKTTDAARQSFELTKKTSEHNEDESDIAILNLPKDIEVFQLNGPLFFGVANILNDVIDRTSIATLKAFILDMKFVPAIDATGIHELEEFIKKCQKQNVAVILCGIQTATLNVLKKMSFQKNKTVHIVAKIEDAAELARKM